MSGYYYYPQFIDKETETMGGSMFRLIQLTTQLEFK